ncbi:hypothetical protein ACVESR_001750, partial [Enterobacter hormaechei]
QDVVTKFLFLSRSVLQFFSSSVLQFLGFYAGTAEISVTPFQPDCQRIQGTVWRTEIVRPLQVS